MNLIPVALARLAAKSLWNRRGTAALSISAIAISVSVLLGVQMLRLAMRESFAQTVSGVDLLVGARTGPIDLLLSCLFQIGAPRANVSWETYEKIAHHPDVAWTIPISLGDSHRGFRVLGTTVDYFRYFHYADHRSLQFAAGGPFVDLYDAVIGAQVARSLEYRVGNKLVLEHGVAEVNIEDHSDKPFRIAAVLSPTGTEVDRTVYVSLAAITAMHLDWRGGSRAPPRQRLDAARARELDLTPKGISAFMIGMRSRPMLFTMERAINDYRSEALLAIIPGAVLSDLWSVLGIIDSALMLVASLVFAAGLLGMLTAILTSLNERRREIAILRSVGARPVHAFALLMSEAALLAGCGVIVGTAVAVLGLTLGGPGLGNRFGIYLSFASWDASHAAILGGVLAVAVLAGIIPAISAYRGTLNDGLTLRI
jgi:putative ABC transport system permease protein